MFELIEDTGLKRLDQQVAELERERGAAEGEAHRLRLQVRQAREHDLNAEAAALNAGKRPPKPQEPEIRRKLEQTERRLEVLGRRAQLAQGAVTAYIAEHRDELREALIRALGGRANQLAEHARAAVRLYGEIMDNQCPLRKELAPPAPVEEATPSGQDTTDFLGVAIRTNVHGEPYERGHVEAMLSYLVSLEERYTLTREGEEGSAA